MLLGDIRSEVHENTSRKSFGRRRQFRLARPVRLFEIQEQNTNNSNSPATSPAAGPSQQHGAKRLPLMTRTHTLVHLNCVEEALPVVR